MEAIRQDQEPSSKLGKGESLCAFESHRFRKHGEAWWGPARHGLRWVWRGPARLGMEGQAWVSQPRWKRGSLFRGACAFDSHVFRHGMSRQRLGDARHGRSRYGLTSRVGAWRSRVRLGSARQGTWSVGLVVMTPAFQAGEDGFDPRTLYL